MQVSTAGKASERRLASSISVATTARSLARSHSAGSRIPTRRRDRAEASLSSLVSARYPESLGNAGSLSVADAVDAFEVLTVAGSGRLGVSDGPAERAAFAMPSSVLQLPDGSLLVCDTANNRLCRLMRHPGGDGSGGGGASGVVVSTVCAKVSWLSPSGLALLADGSGVLVSDSGHHKLRRIELATWAVTSWAGAGKKGHRDGVALGNDGAQFDSPGGLCVCPDGTVLVADTGNHCLRAISTSAHGGRSVRTVAGCPCVRGHRDGAAYVARFDV